MVHCNEISVRKCNLVLICSYTGNNFVYFTAVLFSKYPISLKKSSRAEQYLPPSIKNMEQCPKLKLMAVTFQSNYKFTEHVKNMLYSANKSKLVFS